MNAAIDRKKLLDPFLVAVAGFPDKPLQIAPQQAQQLMVDMAAGQADGLTLQQPANGVKIAHFLAAKRFDHRPAVVQKFDDARLFEFNQGLANWSGANPKSDGQLIGNQARACRQFALNNRLQQPLHDMVSQSASRKRSQRIDGICVIHDSDYVPKTAGTARRGEGIPAVQRENILFNILFGQSVRRCVMSQPAIH